MLAALAPGASAEQLDELEPVVGQPLTPILRDLLAWHNGTLDGAVNVRIDGPWSLMSVEEIIGTVEMMRDLLHGEPGWIEQTWWSEDWVPFLDDGGGDNICVDLTGDGHTLQRNRKPYQGVPGQLIMFDHEAEWRTVEAPSLQTWLSRCSAD
ncbi:MULTISPECIES: SMI1/KNR4 family protein [unclassified Mycobacterium]|uniref:SMI1/KNR4 family protein n=1 Tax=unclassified Mycobacterium TaxID=2642494 RepID=UPI001481D363|nr:MULTISPECIES: SMI1/KNR4 family protein [unclassified Mycobacterium]